MNSWALWQGTNQQSRSAWALSLCQSLILPTSNFIDLSFRHTSKISHQVLEEYNEMIMDTAYNLEIHLQRIDEKLALFTTENPGASDTSVDLKDERAVTKQCLRICEDAKSYIESLIDREPSL